MVPERTAQMIKADLRRARAWWIRETADPAERRQRRERDFLKVVDSAGRVVDFHSLRASFITALVRGGASVKPAQQVARHSDAALTLNLYARPGIADVASALDALPAADVKRPAPKTKAKPGKTTKAARRLKIAG